MKTIKEPARDIPVRAEADVLVVGGGPAGIMAAEAEAQSILKVQQAMADSMRLLNENAPNDQVIKLKALEALQKVADGKATKLIVPSDMQNLAATVSAIKEISGEVTE